MNALARRPCDRPELNLGPVEPTAGARLGG